jgi:Phosphotransferase enzyme family
MISGNAFAKEASLPPPLNAAWQLLEEHRIQPDRCDILQNSHTLVARLTADLVVRIVQDQTGPRQGTAWFERENDIARHLTAQGAPTIPLHPGLPQIAYLKEGYPMNFWLFVQRLSSPPSLHQIGLQLAVCHHHLRSYPHPLPHLSILTESQTLLENNAFFAASIQQRMHQQLQRTIQTLAELPAQAVHGDAHLQNVIQTDRGLLWTDWEDAFHGPVEWDVASMIWNAQILDQKPSAVAELLQGYQQAGGSINEKAMQHCLIARAIVMTAWYPILYPQPDAIRQRRLQQRLDWLSQQPA